MPVPKTSVDSAAVAAEFIRKAGLTSGRLEQSHRGLTFDYALTASGLTFAGRRIQERRFLWIRPAIVTGILPTWRICDMRIGSASAIRINVVQSGCNRSVGSRRLCSQFATGKGGF